MSQLIRVGLTALAFLAAIAALVWVYESWRIAVFQQGEDAGAARVQRQWDADRATAQAEALATAKARAQETFRRLEAQDENQRAQDALLERMRRDLAGARLAAGRLQLRASAYLDAAGCGGRIGDSALECVRAATQNALNVLGSCSRRVVELGEAVDDARARGLKCEADYDALVLRPSTQIPATATGGKAPPAGPSP